jgi:phosphotransferase system  glucose/maltose/N-acetylglucosamine-specific IIC component
VTTPINRPEAGGFDDVRIVEKDIVEPRLQSSLLRFGTGTDGLFIVTLIAMVAVALLLAKLLPSVSQQLSNLQAISLGR